MSHDVINLRVALDTKYVHGYMLNDVSEVINKAKVTGSSIDITDVKLGPGIGSLLTNSKVKLVHTASKFIQNIITTNEELLASARVISPVHIKAVSMFEMKEYLQSFNNTSLYVVSNSSLDNAQLALIVLLLLKRPDVCLDFSSVALDVLTFINTHWAQEEEYNTYFQYFNGFIYTLNAENGVLTTMHGNKIPTRDYIIGDSTIIPGIIGSVKISNDDPEFALVIKTAFECFKSYVTVERNISLHSMLSTEGGS